ncbi:MAG: type IV pilus assembly protein PilM [Thermodesulfobacteriota bacterium]
MAHNLIGVDLGSQTVKLVAFKIGERGPLLTHLAVKAIPWEEEKDLSFGKEVLKAIFHEINLKPQKVRLVCSGTGMHIRRLSLPAMPPEELKEAVRWELKNQIPQSIEAMEVRFHILGEKPEEGGSPRLDLIAVACPQSTLERLLTIAAKAEIKPTHLDVAPFALWNLILTCQENASAEDLAILDMGAEKTGIYIWQKGVLQFSREIIPGGADFTRAIREGLDPGEKPHLLFTRAEKIKQIIGIPVQGPFPSIPGESISIAKITFLMRPVLERLVGEISRSLEYFRAQISGKNIDRLLLCGGGANMKNMAFYLSQELRLPVERFNPWKFLPFDPQNIDPQTLEELGPQLALAAGVALPPIKEMNFLPEKKSWASRLRQGSNPYYLGSSLAAAIFAFLIWGGQGDLSRLQKEYEQKIVQLQDLERLPLTLSSLKEKERQMKQNLLFLSSAQVGPLSHREILAEMRSLIPANVTITQLSMVPKGLTGQKGSLSNIGEKELQILGVTFGQNAQCLSALAQLLERLEKSSLFRNVKLVAAGENKQFTAPAMHFEIVSDLDLERQRK